ncbi:hypothetical protein J2S74_003285 [Evansella vedderi]|uniref:Uncharacterized protein n=1 Tax=Evansella vedderi TaxID=38282 RepID=A0ABT9ZXD3_9BACI|nr:hypothetical protein [Evansella vedderi]MDQ0255901.1 hypothetical protein [Evansella vedderi]
MKKFSFFLIYVLLFLLLHACGSQEVEDDHSLNIMFISEVPVNFQESFGPYIEEILSDSKLAYEDLDINVELFPVSHDKLTIEIVNRDVDIFIVDESLRHILLDPYGLQSLDPLLENLPESYPYEEFIMNDEETGEPHLYAIPLDNDSTLVRDLGLVLPSYMIGAITSVSSHRDIGMYILSEFQ